MSVTGVLLTYERQLIAWSDCHFRSVPPRPGAARLPVETLLGTPAARPIRTSPRRRSPSGPRRMRRSRWPCPQRTLYVDAYTGALLGEGIADRAPGDERAARLAPLDRRRGRGTAGRSRDHRLVQRHLPVHRRLRHLPVVPAQVDVAAGQGGGRSSTARARGKARDFNWHNVIGIWSAVPLFIVVISAVPISFPWGNALVYRAVGEDAAGAARTSGRAGRARAVPPARARRRAGRAAGRPAAPHGAGVRVRAARGRGERRRPRTPTCTARRAQRAVDARRAAGARLAHDQHAHPDVGRRARSSSPSTAATAVSRSCARRSRSIAAPATSSPTRRSPT